ncbi:DJ-1 family glyoxalase III [Methanothrix thermoacetophila]|uniref:DJ-1 family protein n=1 Tax=Methanothrix thermoacetophila (strain DSM 6194 / JCM 14653 / NBRC 101360 / PT) TaxID=349307 RepID=A0B7B8_METTP|nr:DJ-1 family glyoxalase III [Methanothrix thermoacetophila]ABK14592.1 DJ-1 family protein [Methanothrix thermoacetophila PT]
MKVVVPLAEGFEEIEFVTVVDILRRAGIDVEIAGLRDGPVQGSHGVRVIPDTTFDKVDLNSADAIVLPGGNPGFINLGKDERVLDAVRKMSAAGKYVAAICGAPSVLVKAGVLSGRMATVHPAGKEEVAACARYMDERVVVDGKMVTSQGPGTAMDFALKLVELLAGKEAMLNVGRETLVLK